VEGVAFAMFAFLFGIKQARSRLHGFALQTPKRKCAYCTSVFFGLELLRMVLIWRFDKSN
jgi:hypothetical protein